jgi:hypothetical protein
MSKNILNRIFHIFIVVLLVVLAMIAATAATINFFPRLGAKGADLLRTIVGPQPVGHLEEFIYNIQDVLNQAEYKIGWRKPIAPWQDAKISENALSAISTPPSNPATPTSSGWVLSPVPPLGDLEGEGIWTPYIQDASGNTVAYRTFLQPDPKRPFVVVAIVAFDLAKTHLNYVIGTKEPEVKINPKPLGIIPARDRQPGKLLATFNGGYKTVNGHFGIMYDNSVLLKPIDKMGTVALYKDGNIQIGEWGTDIKYTKDMVSFRQNCPLMVHNGEVNPLVYDNSVNMWGGTISGFTVDYRSGLGISQDGKVLYYFAGQGTTMPDLSISMQKAGAYQAMQLDINSYYVLFTSIKFVNGKFQAYPLLPKGMKSNVDRYLGSYTGDFFYITAMNSKP